MRAAARIGNVVLVCLLVVAGYGVFRAGRAAKVDRARRADHRPLVLGPAGLGRLRLGMTQKEAAATGESTLYGGTSRDAAKCSSEDAYGTKIYFSRNHGIVGLTGPPERTRTPEGVGAGATVADVTAAYPTLAEPELGTAQQQADMFGAFSAPAPGNPKAVYRFIFWETVFTIDGSGTRLKPESTLSDHSKLKYVRLELRGQDEDCLLFS